MQFLAGALAGSEAEAIDGHLATCATCRDLLVEVARSATGATLAAGTTPSTVLASPPEAGARGLARGASIGRYMVLDVLGSGGMGVVYAAFDPELDRKVAVKVLRPELADDPAAKRLLREGRAIAKLAHPNVVAVFDVGTDRGS